MRKKDAAGVAALQRGLLLGCAALALNACGEKIETPTPPPPTITIFTGNPNSDQARCGCSGSRPQFLRNSGPSAKYVKWAELRKDRISGETYTPQYGTVTLAPTLPGQEGQFLGCTIDAPTTSCRFDVQRHIVSNASLVEVPRELQRILGTRVAASAESCSAICSAPNSGSNGTCLPLGVRYYQAVAPIRPIVDAAISSGAGVKKRDLMETMGQGEADDKCERTDISNNSGLLVNRGPSYCKFRSADLPPAVLRRAGIRTARSAGMSIIVPPEVRYQATAGGRPIGLLAQQNDDQTAMSVVFDGAGAQKLNSRYGGSLQSISRIAVSGRPPQTVLQTTNGCIAIDESAQ